MVRIENSENVNGKIIKEFKDLNGANNETSISNNYLIKI